MSEMISENGAVRDPNAIAADSGDSTVLPTAPVMGDPAMMELPEISMEEAEDILEDTGPILTDPEDSTKLEELEVSLSSSLEQLTNVRNELEANGYINRSEAAMLKNLTASAESITGFFERHPISSFTEMDSKVNYAATCESLGKSLIDTVISIIKTIVKYIVSIGKWFVAFLTGRRRKDQLNDQADKAVEKKNQALDKQVEELQAERAKAHKLAVDAVGPKMQPLYTRAVELLVAQPNVGPGDPFCREEMTDFANLSQSNELARQIKEASGWQHQAIIKVSQDQSFFINQYSKMAKVCPELNKLPLQTLGNYPGLLTVLRAFKAHITKLSSTPSNALLDEASMMALRKFTQATPHVRFNNLLTVIDTNIKANKDTLSAIEANTEKMKGTTWLPDDFFPSRQRAAQQVKDQQLVLQELTQIQSLFAAARDRSSQIVLEYCRARDS